MAAVSAPVALPQTLIFIFFYPAPLFLRRQKEEKKNSTAQSHCHRQHTVVTDRAYTSTTTELSGQKVGGGGRRGNDIVSNSLCLTMPLPQENGE